jgi:hypothetical protein
VLKEDNTATTKKEIVLRVSGAGIWEINKWI